MPNTCEIGVGGMRPGDFIPADKPEIPDMPRPSTCHIKITCKWCGNLIGHFRVEGDLHYIGVELEPCRECLTGMSLNQQITQIGDEDEK